VEIIVEKRKELPMEKFFLMGPVLLWLSMKAMITAPGLFLAPVHPPMALIRISLIILDLLKKLLEF
jgi:hypothetical protein